MTSWNVGDGLGEQYTELYEVQAMEGRTFIMVDWTGDPPRHMAEANVKKVAEKLCKEQACRIQYCLQGTERDDWAISTVPMLT